MDNQKEKEPPLCAKQAEESLRDIESRMERHENLYRAAKTQDMATIQMSVYRANVKKLQKLTQRCVDKMKQLETEGRKLEADAIQLGLERRQLRTTSRLYNMDGHDVTNPKYMSAEERMLYFMALFHAKKSLEENWWHVEEALVALRPTPAGSDWRCKAYSSPLNMVLTRYARQHRYYRSSGVSLEELCCPYFNDGASFHRLIRAAAAHMEQYSWTFETLDTEIRKIWPDYAERFHQILKETGILCLLRIKVEQVKERQRKERQRANGRERYSH